MISLEFNAERFARCWANTHQHFVKHLSHSSFFVYNVLESVQYESIKHMNHGFFSGIPVYRYDYGAVAPDNLIFLENLYNIIHR